MALRNDYRPKVETFAWLDQHEQAIFDRYVEIGRYKTVVKELGEAMGGGLTERTFYEWLKATDERWAAWQDALEVRGHMSAAEAEEIAERATQQDANASRLKYEAKMRAAEWQNRGVFGKRPEVQVAVGVGGEWAAALDAVVARAGIAATHPSGHALTRASVPLLEAPRTVPEQGSEGSGDGS